METYNYNKMTANEKEEYKATIALRAIEKYVAEELTKNLNEIGGRDEAAEVASGDILALTETLADAYQTLRWRHSRVEEEYEKKEGRANA